jgi:Xaa-Pro aminopeptidase
MLDVGLIQEALRQSALDGWLFYDFRGSNALARRILALDDRSMGSRRFLYWIPAEGQPRKLVHRIEAGALDALPGEKHVYLSWQEFEAGIAALVQGSRRIAMEYAPRNAIPYVSRVDAGTVELVSGLGVQVVSSGDLIQQFEAAWSDQQWQGHLQAAKYTDSAYARAWAFIADRVRRDGSVLETAVQQVILDHFAQHGLVCDHGPIVGVGPHSGDPHFETCPEHDMPIRPGDLVLIDLWAKMNQPGAVYSDLTRMAVVDTVAQEQHAAVFEVVCRARDAAIDKVRSALRANEPICGWHVDDAARHVIEDAGFGPQFIHRTGHSIGQEVHGNGANMDNLEMHDERRILPRTCFSVEPGIYLPEFGMRSEVNVFVDASRQVHVTGGQPQTAIMPILAHF